MKNHMQLLKMVMWVTGVILIMWVTDVIFINPRQTKQIHCSSISASSENKLEGVPQARGDHAISNATVRGLEPRENGDHAKEVPFFPLPIANRVTTSLPTLLFTQTHIDGFWSSARFRFLSFWLAKRIREKVEFDLVVPVLAYKEHGEFSTAVAEFSTLFDVEHLARTLKVNCTTMSRFQEMNQTTGIRVWLTEADASAFRKSRNCKTTSQFRDMDPTTGVRVWSTEAQASAFRKSRGSSNGLVGFQSPSDCPDKTKKLVDVVVETLPKKFSGSADYLQQNIEVVESNPGAKIVFVGPPVRFKYDIEFWKVRHFLNGEKLPPKLQATFEAASLFRFSRPIQNAATFILKKWGIHNNSFAAAHIRRGNTYHMEGRNGQVTVEEFIHFFKRAVHTSGCNFPSAIVVSALRNSVNAETEALKQYYPQTPIFHFDTNLWKAVAENVPSFKGCKGSICQDLVEVAVWLKADLFLGTRSTMSEFTFILRMRERGVAQRDHCSFDSQPCFSFDNSYYRRSPSERIACKQP